MSEMDNSINEVYELLSIVQFIDVGLVVLDRDYRVTLWNGFMENHSGLSRSDVDGKVFSELFPEIPQEWLRKKIDSVIHLNNRSFSVWKQRPFLMKFKNSRPITGRSEWMYQNVTIFPIANLQCNVEKVCLMIYDVTDMAIHEEEAQEVNKQLEELSKIDGLTQLLNRRTWENLLQMEYKRLQRSHAISTLVMFDIDHFKRVNDSYGHPAGDEVIRTVSKVLRDQKRDTDVSGRYGGEEFGVILPDTDGAGGMVFCERLRKAIEDTVITHNGQHIPITVSLGLAEVSFDGNSYMKWLQFTDEALYEAKQSGRNRSVLFSRQSQADEAEQSI